MRKNRLRGAALAATALAAALSLTACSDTGAAKSGSSLNGSSSSSDNTASASGTSDSSAADSGQSSDAKDSGTKAQGGTSSTGTAGGSGADVGNGERAEVGQACGANDINWSTREESQAGGYILIIAKAKPGITCTLPGTYPVVAFGSGGIEAGPAEQAVGDEITLSGKTTAYAGMNPKTTNNDFGVEFEHLIVAVDQEDPNPESLPVNPVNVDKPIVTNWHTNPADAVPFSS
ncbi:hypothetical protein ACIOJD_06585 [Streptomyces sp. NPDC088116]|uniref:hypothetical protein n=1 Tax=Streptomyces sp. NPDC088116 TaxID=3365825 RepID=UPI0038261287